MKARALALALHSKWETFRAISEADIPLRASGLKASVEVSHEARAKLDEWGERVLEKAREAGVGIKARSAFRTLNLFTPQFFAVEGKTNAQEKVEAMWNEKLSRLQAIIGTLDA
jgi:hypothetical protein